MATRGALGGLARAAGEMVLALEAGGFDIIMVETVGAGQSEVDIARLAHTTIVVEAPGLGDGIQAGKAGILEIADILVVNKSDKSSAETAARHLANMLEIGTETNAGRGKGKSSSWKVPILKTSALNDNGIGDLANMIAKHHAHLHESGAWEERERVRIKDLFERLLHEKVLAEWQNSHKKSDLESTIEEIRQRRISPRQAVDRFL
jgi:LAO/AO transport system kinase